MRRKMSLSLLLVTAWALGAGITAGAAPLFLDSFNDGAVTAPTFAASGVEWTVGSGQVSADAANPPGAFCGVLDDSLMFSAEAFTSVSVDFGATATGTPVEVNFKLHQGNGAQGGSYTFSFGLVDTTSGKSYIEPATLYKNFYGSSGFLSYNDGGAGIAGAYGCSLTNSWNYMKMIFDPLSGVQIWQAIDASNAKSYSDASLVYTQVAFWSNFKNVTSVDQFYMDNNGGAVSWKVDDVEIDGTAVVPEPGSLLAIATGLASMLAIRRRKS